MVVALALLATAWAMALVPLAKAGISKTPMGPFQMMVLASAISLLKSAMDLGPMSSAISSMGKGPSFPKIVVTAFGANLSARTLIDGQEKADAILLRFGERSLRDVDLVGFDEGLAGGLALRVEEGVSHASADDDGVGFIEQVIDDHNFVGDFRSADDGDKGLNRVSNGLAKVGEFLVHKQASGRLLDEVGDAFRRGVSTVGAPEGVVDEDVAEAGELFCKGRGR